MVAPVVPFWRMGEVVAHSSWWGAAVGPSSFRVWVVVGPTWPSEVLVAREVLAGQVSQAGRADPEVHRFWVQEAASWWRVAAVG